MAKRTRAAVAGLCLAALCALAAIPAAAAPVEHEIVEVFSPDGSIARVRVPVAPQAPLEQAEQQSLAGSEVRPLHVSGPSNNRLDLVIVGDGYTADQMDLYHRHAADKWQVIAGTEPFTSYATLFNVWMVDVISAESGVDNDPRPPTQRNTALDMQFWCNGTERLLCVDQAKAKAAAAAAPAADQIVVLANSTKYGGAGGAVATSSGGSLAAGLITVHELGHSLGGLADEYDDYYRAGTAEDSTQDITIPAPYAYYPGAALGEPGGVNITAESNPQQLTAKKLKWWRWVGEPSPDGGTTGAFEGAGYYRYGMYRPSQDSLMHSLGIADGGNPFNLPSREEMVRKFYGKVRPIDAAPAAGPLAPGVVAVDVIEPASHALDVRWFLDGREVAAGSTTFDLTPELAAAHRELRVTVADATPFVRNPDYLAAMSQTLRWDI